MRATNNLRVRAIKPLPTPEGFAAELPLGERGSDTVAVARDEIRRILTGEDDRLLVVVGPCSIHDPEAAREYAGFVIEAQRSFRDRLCILMRVYFEKPRTTVGWKGLINDPHLDGSYDLEHGLRLGRGLLVELAHMGIPAASEILDPIMPQYLGDVIAWAAIGARTIESQTHREMTSGLSMPVGLKNGTDGGFQNALNAMRSARQAHHFLGIDPQGRVGVVATAGNPDTHLVMRGGASGPNYDERHVRAAAAALVEERLCGRVMVDCSHDNSHKDYRRQPVVSADVARQVSHGGPLLGVMIESNLVAGKQAFPPPQGVALRHGQSVTDGCVDLPTTTKMLDELAVSVVERRRHQRSAAGLGVDAVAVAPPR